MYPAKTIIDADYDDDIAILAKTPNQAETLLHSLERAVVVIGFHVNAHKTEYKCYNQTGDISTLDGYSLKLVDKFTYLGSSISSTKKDIDTRLTKTWTAIDRLSIILKSDLTDKMKRSFFQAAFVSILLYGWTTWTLTKRLEKKLDGNYTRMLRAIFNNTPQGTNYTEKHGRLISDVLLWTPTYGRVNQDDQLEHTYRSYVRIRDVALETCQRRRTIGRSGERGSVISVLAAWHDDDDDDMPFQFQ